MTEKFPLEAHCKNWEASLDPDENVPVSEVDPNYCFNCPEEFRSGCPKFTKEDLTFTPGDDGGNENA